MSFIKQHIKLIIAIALAASCCVIYLVFFFSSPKDEDIILPVRTITLQKGNYNTTVSVTGKVESQDVSTVSSTVTGAKIASVNVEVGDTVNKGILLLFWTVN